MRPTLGRITPANVAASRATRTAVRPTQVGYYSNHNVQLSFVAASPESCYSDCGGTNARSDIIATIACSFRLATVEVAIAAVALL